MTHKLKTWPNYFIPLWDGSKTFEIRKDDRGFRVGDRLSLLEYDNGTDTFTGRWMDFAVTYCLSSLEFFQPGYVCMGIRILARGTNGYNDCHSRETP